MQLKNSGAEAISLVSASSSIAENVELHNHINEDGVMKMRQVELISISANGNASLEPGGYHIMLIGLSKEIAAGDMVDLEVKFSDGSSQQLTVPVKKVMAHSHHHHH
jgi:copper(I)-binding protein